ncbi:alpha-amylase family glycosyl hydrolase [Streptomyces sp. NBC_01017]|uniref:alpha-amylase family glycosyl hydrolase n=1 Tax=Streptomyces sp. NBC_01017 TaxID=2903721 RepID=UPI00386A6DE6
MNAKHIEIRRWWRDAVIYQVYVRNFLDSADDGIGELAGVRAGLSYRNMLGVDGIRLSRFHPSPRHDHGYDVAEGCDIAPLFGDLAEFGLLMADVHRHGIKVLLDIVPSHCSGEHPWFREALASASGSPVRARLHFADGHGANSSELPHSWHAMEHAERNGRERRVTGEVSVPTTEGQAKYLRPGGLHRAFFFDLLGALWGTDAFRKVISEAMQETAASTVTWVLNNHDQVRAVTRYGAPAAEVGGLGARARTAALLISALPGSASIDQGEGLGLIDDVLTHPIFPRTGSRARIRGGCGCRRTDPVRPFGFTRCRGGQGVAAAAGVPEGTSMMMRRRTTLLTGCTTPALTLGAGTCGGGPHSTGGGDRRSTARPSSWPASGPAPSKELAGHRGSRPRIGPSEHVQPRGRLRRPGASSLNTSSPRLAPRHCGQSEACGL